MHFMFPKKSCMFHLFKLEIFKVLKFISRCFRINHLNFVFSSKLEFIFNGALIFSMFLLSFTIHNDIETKRPFPIYPLSSQSFPY
jgi:hypothetical protein